MTSNLHHLALRHPSDVRKIQPNLGCRTSDAITFSEGKLKFVMTSLPAKIYNTNTVAKLYQER